MTDRIDLENAIMDAEGASAVLSFLQTELMSSTVDGWQILGMKPRENLVVMAVSSNDHRALHYAMNSLQHTVAEVSRVFYAKDT